MLVANFNSHSRILTGRFEASEKLDLRHRPFTDYGGPQKLDQSLR